VSPTNTTTGCKTGTLAPPCTKPISGTMMHLVFSHLPVTTTFRRPNGQPLPDIATALQ
jgi:hypothetical protein